VGLAVHDRARLHNAFAAIAAEIVSKSDFVISISPSLNG
jgi:hypothetical protein